MGRCGTCGGWHAEGPEHCPGPAAIAETAPLEPGAPPASVIPHGTLLEGVYRVGDCIGQGAMGAVYVVEHVELGKRFAAKVLATSTAADPEAVLRLQNEARAASAIEHDNIVNVTHLGRTAKGSVFIVMELLEGESLRARLLRQSVEAGDAWLPDAEARTIGEQILAGLGAAHRAGIIHRDLKPENVLLARKEDRVVVKLVDFGISKLVSPSDVRLTRTGQVFGTPLYMSPEQGRSAADVDHRTDLYAAGVILYELVTGIVPFEGSSVSECLVRHATEPPPPPSLRRPTLPGAVEAVILKCLAKKPEHRYASAQAALDAWRAAWAAPAAVAVGTLQPTSRSTTPPARASRAKMALGAVVVVGLASWLGSMAAGPASTTRARAPRGTPVSPLLAEDAILACPLLAASGVEEPSGWLGAAAAAIVCERGRVILGGRYERTLVPAELLDLPRAPVDDFPADPYAHPDARARSTAAAKTRAAAWVEGEVTSKNPGFRVALRLKAKDGRELGRGKGDGRALYEAVRAAMEPLVSPGGLPKAPRLDAEIAEWSRATTVEAALALADLHVARWEIAGSLEEECERIDLFAAAWREVALPERAFCASQLGRASPSPSSSSFEIDRPAPFRAQLETALLLGAPEIPDEVLTRLRDLRTAERSMLGRALLGVTESCVIQARDPHRARELALMAPAAHPKTIDTTNCDPWGQLAGITEYSAGAVRGSQAWRPWGSATWLAEPGGRRFFGSIIPFPVVPRFVRRMQVLAPLNAYAAAGLVEIELLEGRPDNARRAALALASDALEANRVAAELLLARIDASEARFARVFERSARFTVVGPNDGAWLALLRFRIAWQALRASEVTGHQDAWAERLLIDVLRRDLPPSTFVDLPDSHPAVAATCLLASRARRAACFEQMHELESIGRFTNDTVTAAALTEGAKLLARGDARGAATAWRPLLREGSQFPNPLDGPMAEVFDETGEVDLAERVDEAAATSGSVYNGASLAHVRQARRASSRGDRDRALALARKVIDAWSVADVLVPAVDEMRQLVARLERSR